MATKTKSRASSKTAVRKPAAKKQSAKATRQVIRQASAKKPVQSLHLDVQRGIATAGIPSVKRLQTWATAAYEVHHAAHARGRTRVVPPVQVSLRIVGAAESRKLNREWRDEDHATNVLSFPAGEGFESDELPTLGDLAICAPIVKKEALTQGKSLESHWAHMMMHGVLHLLGYDHEVDRDAQVMEACEVAIMESFGFANPYDV